MAPELSISHSSNFNILTDNPHTTWNMLVSAQLTSSIEIEAKHHDSKYEWNDVVSPSKRNNIKLISQKKSWNEINSKQSLNTLNYDKIQKKTLAIPSKNIINISVMSNKKKQQENYKSSQVRITFDKCEKKWKDTNQKVIRNGEFCVEKIKRPENKLDLVQRFTVRSISNSVSKERKNEVLIQCHQESFTNNSEEITNKSLSIEGNCRCQCHKGHLGGNCCNK